MGLVSHCSARVRAGSSKPNRPTRQKTSCFNISHSTSEEMTFTTRNKPQPTSRHLRETSGGIRSASDLLACTAQQPRLHHPNTHPKTHRHVHKPLCIPLQPCPPDQFRYDTGRSSSHLLASRLLLARLRPAKSRKTMPSSAKRSQLVVALRISKN